MGVKYEGKTWFLDEPWALINPYIEQNMNILDGNCSVEVTEQKAQRTI